MGELEVISLPEIPLSEQNASATVFAGWIRAPRPGFSTSCSSSRGSVNGTIGWAGAPFPSGWRRRAKI